MQERNPNSGAREAYDTFAETIKKGLTKAAETLGNFDKNLDTGVQVGLEGDPKPLPRLEQAGRVVGRKRYGNGVSNIGDTLLEGTTLVGGTPTGALPNVLSVTLEIDEGYGKEKPKAPRHGLALIGQIPATVNGPSRYTMVIHGIEKTNGENRIVTTAIQDLDLEELQAPVVKGEVLKLAPKTQESRSKGVPGYRITDVSSLAMER